MSPFLRVHPGAMCFFTTLGLIGLTGCASEREQAAWADWRTVNATFRPMDEAPAAITSTMSLADYVKLAVERNPQIQAHAQRWRAGLERIPQARSLPDPQVTYGGFLEEVETRIGPQRHTFGFSQRLPWPGKLSSAGDMALEDAGAVRARTDAVRLGVVFEVTTAYADYYYLAREVVVVRETLALVQHWESVAQARLRAGARAAHRDVIKAQVEIGRLEDRLATLVDARQPHAARLRAVLDLPPATELPWPQTLPQPSLSVEDERVAELLTQNSPRLAELDRRIKAREIGVELSRQSYFPDFMVGLDFVEVGPAVRNAAGGRARGSGDDAVVAKFGFSLPIWFGRNAASVSEAKARLRAAELDREDTRLGLEASSARALFNYRDAERKIQLYRGSLVPKAEEALQTMSAAFEGGNGDFLDVLDAERVLLQFHLAREKALADRVRSLAELEMLMGAEPGSASEEDPR